MRLVVGDILQLSSPSCDLGGDLGQFEIVSAVGVLHHIATPDVALANLVSRLRPGGVLQIATYSTIGVASWHEGAKRLLHRLAPALVDAAGGPTPQLTISPPTLTTTIGSRQSAISNQHAHHRLSARARAPQ